MRPVFPLHGYGRYAESRGRAAPSARLTRPAPDRATRTTRRDSGPAAYEHQRRWRQTGRTNPGLLLLFLALASWKVKNVRGAFRIARRAGRPLAVVGGHRLNFNMGFRLTLDPNARFHGVIGGERKNRIINRSSALLFPVRWHEPFGVALIEALYFGCPVFGTPYGSLPEIVIPEVGVLADSESELARRLADVGQFDRHRCHQYVCDEFSAGLMTKRYLALYERVLNGESLHDHEPVTLDRGESGLLPMER